MNASRISRVLTLFFALLLVSNVGLAQDECASATATGEATGIALDTSAATVDATASTCGLAAPDVWLAYTASCTGTATIETTSGPGGDTILEVLDACGGTVLACDDDGGTDSQIHAISPHADLLDLEHHLCLQGWEQWSEPRANMTPAIDILNAQ